MLTWALRTRGHMEQQGQKKVTEQLYIKSMNRKIRSYKKILRNFPAALAIAFVFSTTAHCRMVAVKGENVNLRSGPGTAYSVKWEYGAGFPLEVIKEKGDWLLVTDFENDEGWIHKSLVENKPQVIVIANRNNDGTIHIRKEPDTDSEILGKSYYGVVFTTLDKDNGWMQVRHESGLTGWVKEKLLWGY